MKINDFLTTELLGSKFIAVKGYEEVLHHETGDLDALRLNVSIQDEKSPFFMELISIKIKNLSPTVSKETLEANNTTPVTLKDFNMGQFNGALWFNASDILPVSNK